LPALVTVTRNNLVGFALGNISFSFARRGLELAGLDAERGLDSVPEESSIA
jgi:hypothetical protein